jgi:hypothetical protein
MSHRINRYIANSGYATLKNDASGIVGIHITGGFSIPPGGKKVFETQRVLGTTSAPMRVLMKSSKNNNWQPCVCLFTEIENVTIAGMTTSQPVAVRIERISAQIVRIVCEIINFDFNGSMYVGANDNLITARIATFKSPFEL